LTLTAGTTRARPTSVIGYRLTVTNTGGSAAREVVVCDDVPPGQKVLRTVPTAEGADEPCWTVGVLAAGDRRVFRLNAMVEPLAGSGAQRDSATASAANVKGVRRDRVAIGIKPLPATACGSELARPTGSSVAFRC